MVIGPFARMRLLLQFPCFVGSVSIKIDPLILVGLFTPFIGTAKSSFIEEKLVSQKGIIMSSIAEASEGLAASWSALSAF